MRKLKKNKGAIIISIYNFYHHINPDYKKILLEIGVYGRSLPRIEEENNMKLVYINRIRDIFYKDGIVHLFTRLGGNNRETYKKEIDKLRNIGWFIRDFDCDFCNTYAVFLFNKKIDTKEYYRKGYSNEVKMVQEKSDKTKKLMNIMAKLINEEKPTLEEQFLCPYNIFIKENPNSKYNKIFAPLDWVFKIKKF